MKSSHRCVLLNPIFNVVYYNFIVSESAKTYAQANSTFLPLTIYSLRWNIEVHLTSKNLCSCTVAKPVKVLSNFSKLAGCRGRAHMH